MEDANLYFLHLTNGFRTVRIGIFLWIDKLVEPDKFPIVEATLCSHYSFQNIILVMVITVLVCLIYIMHLMDEKIVNHQSNKIIASEIHLWIWFLANKG